MSHAQPLHNRRYLDGYVQIINRAGLPATLSEAQAALAQADPQTMAPLTAGSRYHGLTSTSGGVAQRWMLVYSEHRHAQAQRTVDKQLLKQGQREVVAFQKLGRMTFACEADSQQ